MEEKKVILYTQSNCSHCQEAEEWLVQLAIPFETRNVQENEEFLNELHKRGSLHTPTFVVGEETFIGLNKGNIKRAWVSYVR